jgi:spore coat protein U-like protein
VTARKLVASCGFALVALFLASRPAQAAIHCTWSSTNPVAFGTYDVDSPTPDDANGSVTFNCKGVGGTPVVIDLSTGSSGTFAVRQMTGSVADTLDYNLYLDATRTQIWGDATGGTVHYGLAVPPNNVDVLVNIYGRIPAGQDKTPGNYTDTIVATINF